MTKKQLRQMGIDPNDFDVIIEDEEIIDVDCVILDDDDEED